MTSAKIWPPAEVSKNCYMSGKQCRTWSEWCCIQRSLICIFTLCSGLSVQIIKSKYQIFSRLLIRGCILLVFWFLQKSIHYWYSKEFPHQGNSTGYLKYLFSGRRNIPFFYSPLSCWTRIYPAFANIVAPDQLASNLDQHCVQLSI